MNSKILYPILFFVLCFSCIPEKESKQSLRLQISENHRFLETENGEPFFWLGDTGWLLFKKLNREEAETYFDDRKQKGFNVIQAMLIHDLKNPVNVYGDSAFLNKNVAYPLVIKGNSFENPDEYDYWDHVEYLIDLANQKGLYMGLVPIWGSNVRAGGVTQKQAEKYAYWLAERFKDKTNVIWLNGGDVRGSDSTNIWKTIGNTLKKNNSDQLVTFHPFGRTQSFTWFHNEEWLDFNMFQSGHRRYDQDTTGLCYGEDNYRYVESDYNKIPVKPTLDGEPSYEGIPQGLHDFSQPRWTASDVRRYAYWSVFAGGCGFTYGNNAIMQFHRVGDEDASYGVEETWQKALSAPGASQMKYLKNIMLSRPYFERVPFPEFVSGIQGEKYSYLAATKGQGYVYVYLYCGQTISLDLNKLPFRQAKVSWYDPRTGDTINAGNFAANKTVEFDPPGKEGAGNDWVLVFDRI